MRELIVGILLGILVTTFPNSIWGHQMFSNPDAVVVIALILLIITMLFRPILRWIDRKYPRQIRKFYEFWQPPIINAEHEKREKEQENRGRNANGRNKPKR